MHSVDRVTKTFKSDGLVGTGVALARAPFRIMACRPLFDISDARVIDRVDDESSV